MTGEQNSNGSGSHIARDRSRSRDRHNLNRPTRFPDFILCGQLNLHRSAENAAALSKYIAKQWDYLRINRDGIISSHQLEINRNPEAYGGLRDGKPLTVSEWRKVQRGKLLEIRKAEAATENSQTQDSATGAVQGTSSNNKQDRPRSLSSGGRGSSRRRRGERNRPARRSRVAMRGGGLPERAAAAPPKGQEARVS